MRDKQKHEEHIEGGAKRFSCAILRSKTEHLPRQARDTHRKVNKERCGCLQALKRLMWSLRTCRKQPLAWEAATIPFSKPVKKRRV
jgi:hypothetical protein